MQNRLEVIHLKCEQILRETS